MKAWSGQAVVQARATLAPLIPTPCAQCHRTIHTTDQWIIGHRIPRSIRPDLTWEPSNWQLEHRRCSNKTGQATVIAKARREGAMMRAHSFLGGHPATEFAAVSSLSLWKAPESEEPDSDWTALTGSMPWLAGFAEVPADATPPRYSTARHPHAVGSYGSAFCTWADDHPGMHPRNTEGLRWWQRLAAYRLLEHDDQGRLVWRNALLTMARQVGKSWLVRALVLWRIQHRDLFGGEDQTVIHIAHKLPTATEVWRPAARWAKGQDWHVRWANGEQLVESPEGGRWLIAAAVDGVGVGFSLSMMVADEGWMIRRAVVEAADPALSESASPQLLLISTAGDSRSDLFGSYRRQALDSLTDPVNTLLMEWSAAGSCGVADRDAWRAASPIWSSRREAEILDKLGKLEELEIRQNYLNQWVDVAHGRSEPGLPVFTAEEWAELGGHVAESSPVVAGVEAWFSDGVSVAFAERVGGRVGVSVHMLGSVAEAAAAVAGVRTVLVGKSLGSDPAFAGVAIRPVSGTARGAVVELRRLADEGALMHDGSPELAAQVLTLRTVSGADGPRVRSHGRADAVKAAAWAAVEARVFVDAPRIF